MFAQVQSGVSLKEKMKLVSYQALYSSIRNRLCVNEETLSYDFFTAQHLNQLEYLQRYFNQPTMYHCKGDVGYQGFYGAGNSYLVVSRMGYVVLLLEPEAACARNLPFIAILEDGYFKPYLGDAVHFWQSQVEPCQLSPGGNVLPLSAMSYT